MNNILWLNEGGADVSEAGTFFAPYRSINNLFSYIENNISNFDNWFVMVKPRKRINSVINFNHNVDRRHISNLFNILGDNRKLYFIGMSDEDYSSETDILNDLESRYGPFSKTIFISNIQKHKVSLDYQEKKNRFSENSSKFTTTDTLVIKGNVTFVNFEFLSPVDVIVEGNLKTPTFYKCLFLNQLRIYEDQSTSSGTSSTNGNIPDNISSINSSFNLNSSDRVIINLSMFFNINESNTNNIVRPNQCSESTYVSNRKAAIQAICSAADIYDNVFLNNDVGMIIVSTADTDHNTHNHVNTTSVNIKNCKIFNSKYDGLIATFPGRTNYINKIINVDCSYSKLGNGFKVRNCNLVNCKALWNKFYGFILLDNKYLYKCHAINNQTGILLADTDDLFFRFPYFKFKNHVESQRNYNNNEPDYRTTNFYNCSARGSLGGSGIVYSIYSSYSLFLNCEISGNQGSLESFYDIVKYRTNYYFTGGGIKGFKDNNLFFINTSIVGNLGYGICIIDDIKKILSPTQRTYIDHNGNELSREGSDQYNSYFVVSSCELNGGDYQIKSFETSESDIYSSVASGTSSSANYSQYTISSLSSNQHCRNYLPNVKEAESYIGHIILINSIVSSNRGGQIIKLFDFQNTFLNRYLEINSLIDNYKSDKFFTLPRNVCAWNPYKGVYEVGTHSSRKKIGLYDMVSLYNSISPTSGSHLLYRNSGIFKAFRTPNNVDNARDDLDLRIKNSVDKDSSNFTYNDFGDVPKKILEGCVLFDQNNRITPSILSNINNILIKKLDNTNLNSGIYNFESLYFKNNKSYLPDIFHYKHMGNALERTNLSDYRDNNFILVRNKFFELETDIMSSNLIQSQNYENTHKQFLEIRQATATDIHRIEKNLKELLSYDFDDLTRNIDSNDYYIGCFEKHNYCNYTFNTVGREFNKNTNEFTTNVNCCNNIDNSNCTSNSISIGVGNNYPSGMTRSLIVDYTDQDVSLEQEEMNTICQTFQDNIGLRDRIGVLPDLSTLDVAEDSCNIPNFDMYDFNGTFFETRFICGNDCDFQWNSWVNLIENEESTTSLRTEDLDVYFRTGKLVKLNNDTVGSLRVMGISTNQYIDAEKLYPNICPYSGEFEFDETNEELFCSRNSLNERVERWYCNKRNRNELPLIPDGCPSFGGKKCPVSNVQFAMVNRGQNPDDIVQETSFSIENVIDDIINPNSGVSIDSVVNEISSSDEIDPSDPIYLQSKCLTDGYITPSRGLSGRITKIRENTPYQEEPEKIPVKTLIIIIVVMIILVVATLLI